MRRTQRPGPISGRPGERAAGGDGKITAIDTTADDDPTLDLLVLGTGVAGLSAAVQAAGRGLRVGVLTKGELEQAATRWAQGGVAAVLDEDPDSIDLHLADTLSAGAGLCDIVATRVLVDEGPLRVHQLIALGAMFDRDAEGHFELATEGGHSEPRIVHAGGAATGSRGRAGPGRGGHGHSWRRSTSTPSPST